MGILRQHVQIAACYSSACQLLPRFQDGSHPPTNASLLPFTCASTFPFPSQVGSLPASGDELMTSVTGAPLQPQVFLDYLRDKYSQLYQL